MNHALLVQKSFYLPKVLVSVLILLFPDLPYSLQTNSEVESLGVLSLTRNSWTASSLVDLEKIFKPNLRRSLKNTRRKSNTTWTLGQVSLSKSSDSMLINLLILTAKLLAKTQILKVCKVIR
jgi:hypothetical protein